MVIEAGKGLVEQNPAYRRAAAFCNKTNTVLCKRGDLASAEVSAGENGMNRLVVRITTNNLTQGAILLKC